MSNLSLRILGGINWVEFFSNILNSCCPRDMKFSRHAKNTKLSTFLFSLSFSRWLISVHRANVPRRRMKSKTTSRNFTPAYNDTQPQLDVIARESFHDQQEQIQPWNETNTHGVLFRFDEHGTKQKQLRTICFFQLRYSRRF